MSTFTLPPVAERRFGYRVRDIHGDHFDDGWDWLRDESNADVVAHLDAENHWADHMCKPTESLATAIAGEVKGHTALDDVSVPVLDGDYWYFRKWHKGDSYATHHRVPADRKGLVDASALPPQPSVDDVLPGETLILDENALAKGQEFFKVADIQPSPDGRLIAWARDTAGDERFTWVVQVADTGEIVDEAVVDAGYGLAWAADSASFIYMGVDDAWRACEVWWHQLGTGRDQDRLLLVDPDERFEMGISDGGDPFHVLIHSMSSTSGQAWVWLPDYPSTRPVSITGLAKRVMVAVDSAGDHLLLVHTALSQEGTLAVASYPSDLVSLATPVDADYSRAVLGNRESGSAIEGGEPVPFAPPSTWVTVREAGAGERLLEVEARASFCVLSMRSNALTQVEYRTRNTAVDVSGDARPRPLSSDELCELWGDGHFVEAKAPVRTIDSVDGPRFGDRFFRVRVQSQIQPETTIQVDPFSGETTLLKVAEAPGWDPSTMVEERVWVTARDGKTQIPVTLIHGVDVRPDGTHPGWELGYGSYEVSYDPEFETLRLPIFERGVVFAIAHIRGGGELGRAWYDDGKEAVKVNTFTDFIDVGRWMVESGWVTPGCLIAEGRSAGGLLMGAVLNMAPDLYRTVIAGVPFVDALTTILDPSLPLTVGEWEEWGNPIESPEIFRIMKGYTPYENVPENVTLPAVMATTSVNDTRIEFVEPTKWVQRLREASGQNTDADLAASRPIVLRTQMVAGHAGPSGREGRWKARAEEFAFALGQVGVPVPAASELGRSEASEVMEKAGDQR